MRIIKHTAAIAFAVLAFTGSTMVAAAGHEQHNQQKCQNDKLYRHLDSNSRITTVTPTDDPIFSSEHYCFGYNDDSNQSTNHHGAAFDDLQIMAMQKSYAIAYKSLGTTEQRIAFVHMFLERLTRKALVFPVTANRTGKEIKIGLKSLDSSGNKATMWQMKVTLSDHEAVYNGLMALPKQTKLQGDWPELHKLAKDTLKGRSGETNNTNETIIQDPTQEDCGVSGDDGSGGGCGASGGDTITWQDWKDWAEKNERDSCNFYLCSMMWEPSPVLPELETCLVLFYPDGTSSDMMYCWAEGGHQDFP